MISRDAAPSHLMQMISCNCKKGCDNACCCRKAGLKCSIVCSQCSEQSCENRPDIIVDMDTAKLDDLLHDDELDGLLVYPNSPPDKEIDQAEEVQENMDTEAEEYLEPGPSKRFKPN